MSVEAMVLAGGRSSRFGGDKLAAFISDRTVLAATVGAVAEVADRVVVLGPAVPSDLGARGTPVSQLSDREPFGGPLIPLAAALERTGRPSGNELVIVVGGDMPRLVPAVLAHMLSLLAATPAIDAVILGAPDPGASRRQVLPLALRLAPAGRAAREAVDAGERSLGSLADRLRVTELPASVWLELDPRAESLIDVDTPEDLDRLRDGPVDAPGRR